MTNLRNQLQNHQGRFTSLVVERVKTGRSRYCAQIRRVTDKTVIFSDVNQSGRAITVPLANVRGVGNCAE